MYVHACVCVCRSSLCDLRPLNLQTLTQNRTY